jgi:choline dehydrogenase-like flavoprotein
MSFDVIVIGSGFGGAITARRLAEKGMRVLVLERGRRVADLQQRRGGGADRGLCTGWPAEITHAELKPYYDAVSREMDLQIVLERNCRKSRRGSPTPRASKDSITKATRCAIAVSCPSVTATGSSGWRARRLANEMRAVCRALAGMHRSSCASSIARVEFYDRIQRIG